MAPPYKLTYFNLTALGEPIRFLLSYGNIDFEDVRVTFEEWPVIKPTTPMGQMPVLEHDGKVAHQSIPICRYLGKKVKLNGANDWEDLEIDAAVETVSDLRGKIGAWHYEKDPAIKETKKGPLFDEILPFCLQKLDELAKKNGGHLALGKLTWADFYFAGLLSYLNNMLGEDLTEKAPNLRAIKDTVYDIPEIKAWLEKRPETSY